MLESII